MGVIAWVVAGLIAGWIAGVTMKGGGYGRIGDLAVGLVGAFAGAWLFVFVVVTDIPNALAWEILAAAIGAAAFVAVARLVTRGSMRGARSALPDPVAGSKDQ
jgi:uncharacterized membrane protein YeaQ/YmgE (transglycosylase-associated protein family)